MKRRIACLILSIGVFVLVQKYSFAYDLVRNKNYSDLIEADFDKDGVGDIVTLERKESLDFPGGGIGYPIITVKSQGKKYVYKGKDVDEIISIYSSGLDLVEVSKEIAPFIALSKYEPGTPHSWTVILYKFNGSSIKKEIEIFSCGPSIKIEDVDDDGENEIVFTSRDYEHNSYEDRFVYTVKYADNQWGCVSCYETRTKIVKLY